MHYANSYYLDKKENPGIKVEFFTESTTTHLWTDQATFVGLTTEEYPASPLAPRFPFIPWPPREPLLPLWPFCPSIPRRPVGPTGPTTPGVPGMPGIPAGPAKNKKYLFGVVTGFKSGPVYRKSRLTEFNWIQIPLHELRGTRVAALHAVAFLQKIGMPCGWLCNDIKSTKDFPSTNYFSRKFR